MGNSIGTTLTASAFSDFFAAFQILEGIQQKQPLSKLQSFFDEFNRLQQADLSSENRQAEPAKQFPVSQYHDFFQRFSPLYQAEKQRGSDINVWQQAGLKQDEVRNTAVLAWWLDCQGTHALGDHIFKSLLSALPFSLQLPDPAALGNYRVTAESLPLGEIENRIDIEIQGKDFLIFIEVKINAGEGDKQLERYHTLLHQKAKMYGLNKRALIYLTRHSSPAITVDDCLCLSWRELALALAAIRLPEPALFTQRLLHQFCQHIQSF